MNDTHESSPVVPTQFGEIGANYYGWYQEVRPASRVWEEEFPTDPDEREAFYRREGFVVFRDLISAAELAALQTEAKRFENEYRTTPQVREGYDLEPIQDPRRALPTFRKIGGICTMSRPFEHLMRNAELLDLMHRVIGADVNLFLDAIYPKPARVGREKPWHQDQAFWQWKPYGLVVQTMTALDDCMLENACLQIIPRTHGNFVPHGGREACVQITEEQQAAAYYLPMRAGDVVAFSSLLLHASEPNRSDTNRSSVFIAYGSPALRYVGNRVPHELIPISSMVKS